MMIKTKTAANQIDADLKISFVLYSALEKFNPKMANIINEKIIILGNEFLILKFRKSLNVIWVFAVIILIKSFPVRQHQSLS